MSEGEGVRVLVYVYILTKNPIPALNGETGLHSVELNQNNEMIKYWLKLFNEETNRID